jgi:hypothetical protein
MGRWFYFFAQKYFCQKVGEGNWQKDGRAKRSELVSSPHFSVANFSVGQKLSPEKCATERY